MPSVDIDDEIYQVLDERSGEKGFDTTDEYVNYVLGQVADKIQRKHGGDDSQSFSDKDEEKVKDRLKQLGYLD